MEAQQNELAEIMTAQLSVSERYVAWREGSGKEKYVANAKKQNKKKATKSVALQIIACRAKLERLIAKEADQKAKALITPQPTTMPDSE